MNAHLRRAKPLMFQAGGLLTKMNIAAIPIDRLLHLHASDWLADTKDLRLDRGMPGDGLIDNRRIRTWMEETGFSGVVEVEIFSKENWWKRDCDDVVKTIIARKDENL